MTDELKQSHHRTGKFRAAWRGVKLGVRGQSSFFVHFFMTAMVLLAAMVLRASLAQWCLLVLSIVLVLTAEMFNSAVEHLAKAITDQHDRRIGNALDISSGAVLIASVGAAAVGAAIFLSRLGAAWGWPIAGG